MVESLRTVHPDEVAQIKEAMQKMLYYIATAPEINTTKHKREWTENFSPAKAQKCRLLSRHPTGETLPEYKGMSSGDTHT